MRKKQKNKENYLERIPKRPEKYAYTIGEDGIVTLEIENKGVFNKIAQKFFKKPKISYVHLDEMGSFIWPLIDGERSIMTIGEMVKEHFGEKAEPLYSRLVGYIQMLENSDLIEVQKVNN